MSLILAASDPGVWAQIQSAFSAKTASAIGKVLGAGLLFGALLPAVFALGVRWFDAGTATVTADGTSVKGNPGALAAGYAAFALVGGAVLIGVLWITKKSIAHYLGIELF